MDLRSLVPVEFYPDHVMTLCLWYSIQHAAGLSHSIPYHDEIVELRPYEVLITFDDFRRHIGIEKERLIEAMEKLQKLKYATITHVPDGLRIHLTRLEFPINANESLMAQGKVPQKITVREWIERDLYETKMRRILSPSTLKTLAMVGREFCDVVGDKMLDQVAHYDYDEFVSRQKKKMTRQKRPISHTSINDYTRCLKASFGRAVKDELIQKNPFQGMKPLQEIKKKPVIFQDEELNQIIARAEPEWLKFTIMFGFLTAERRGEVVNTRWENLNWDHRTIEIRCSKEFNPKGGRERDVPINSEVESLLRIVETRQRERKIESEYVFTDDDGRRLTGDRVNKKMKALIRSIPLSDDLDFHALRRTAATRLDQKHVDSKMIQNILGHSGPKTIEKYVGVQNKEMARAMSMLRLKEEKHPSNIEVHQDLLVKPN